MRKIKLFIATSLDGYIAGPKEEIDWLFDNGDYGYKKFYNSIDTTLMGHKTYKTALSFETHPYKGKKNYVFTKSKQTSHDENAEFVSGDIAGFVRNLKSQKGKDIWLVGGGQINAILLNEGLIDEMIISIHPVILGAGIPLFSGVARQKKFKMTTIKKFPGGLTQITYKKT